MSEKVQIIVMRPAPFGLAPVHKWKTIKVGGVEKLVKGALVHKKKTLMPGGGERNKVEASHWEALKNHKGVINALNNGIIAVAGADAVVPEEHDPDKLIKHQTPEAAKAAIADETDLERLQAWYRNDTRPAVQQAIVARLEVLSAAQSPKTGPTADTSAGPAAPTPDASASGNTAE